MPEVKQIYKTQEELRRFLGIPVDSKVSLGNFTIMFIIPTEEWQITWIETPDNY